MRESACEYVCERVRVRVRVCFGARPMLRLRTRALGQLQLRFVAADDLGQGSWEVLLAVYYVYAFDVRDTR